MTITYRHKECFNSLIEVVVARLWAWKPVEHDEIPLRCVRKKEVVLMLEALLDFREGRVAIDEVFGRVLLVLVINFHRLRAFFDATAWIQKQENLRRWKSNIARSAFAREIDLLEMTQLTCLFVIDFGTIENFWTIFRKASTSACLWPCRFKASA